MSFSSEWDEIYRRGEQQSRWPWTDLVTLVYRYLGRPSKGKRVLEMGCGFGANIPLFNAIEADYFALEGSAEATRLVIERFPSLTKRITCSDFTKDIPFSGDFDLIFDRASATLNELTSLERYAALVFSRIKPGGLYIGIDWYSTDNYNFTSKDGTTFTDPFTKHEFTEGPFAKSGPVHFSDETQLKSIFKTFELLHLEHCSREILRPQTTGRFSAWNFVP